MALEQIRERFPNIEHKEDAGEMTLAEQMANLTHRTYGLIKAVDAGLPKIFLEFQVGIIYSRLDEICEAMELEPITDLDEEDECQD